MYKICEKKAESMLKKASKQGFPEWAAGFVREKINRAKHFRREADSESAKKMRMRDNRFRKAVDEAFMAIEVCQEFLLAVKK